VEIRRRSRQLVEGPLPAALVENHARLAEVGQVSGRRI
jgi:hypothetical protein